jgi:putative FmdB family regulatory protein
MPIYEYRCENCGKITEVLQKRMDLEEQLKCFNCGSKQLKKMISVPAVMIKQKSSSNGRTCCGRIERCDTPPCSDNGTCKSSPGDKE